MNDRGLARANYTVRLLPECRRGDVSNGRIYLGFDVVEEPGTDLRRRCETRNNHFFNTADVTPYVLPAGDAIFCRDVLTHLSRSLVQNALGNCRRSGARFLNAARFPRGRNDPVRSGDWQPIRLCVEPLWLPLSAAACLRGTAKMREGAARLVV